MKKQIVKSNNRNVGVAPLADPKGITLIALVITIVVLIILAGVAINLTLGENGIFTRAENAKEEYEYAQAKEKLELEILEVQTKIMDEEFRMATLEDLLGLIDTAKYEIVLKYEPIASSEIVQPKATYAKVVEIESNIGFIVDDKLVIRDVTLEDIEEEQEITIKSADIKIGTSYVKIVVDAESKTEQELTYKYMLDGVEVASTTENEYKIENLDPESTHVVKVIVQDAEENQDAVERTIKTEARVYLYKEGNQYEELTGGWIAINADNGANDSTMKGMTLTFNSDNMNAYILSDSAIQTGAVAVNNDIDYSKYTKLNIKYTATLGKYSSATIIQVYKNHNNIEPYPANLISNLCYENAITSPKVITIDISQIEDFDNFYIFAQSHRDDGAVNCNIYEVWLEK